MVNCMVDNEEKLDRLFLALGDRTRRKMMLLLSKNESLNVSELGETFEATKQSISKHLKVLESAGLIKKTKDGRIQHCKINPEAIEQVQKVMEQYSRFWSAQLDSLEQFIETVAQNEKKGRNHKK